MGKQRSSMRQVPWQSWEHWKWVSTELFSDAPERISAALDRITAWQSRGKVPIAVETSAALIGIHQRDPQVNHGLPLKSALPEELLRMMYAMAIQRLVNGVVDQSKKHNTSSVADRAEAAGLPRLLVDIRHETAHAELPGLSLLQVASKQALAWLKLQYWDQQSETLVNARMELKSKIVEHCLLVVEILSPTAAAVDLQQSKDEEESDEEKEDLLEAVQQETLRDKKQRRNELFQELLDLSLSSSADLISIIVGDGLLKQNTLPSLDNLDQYQPIKADSTGSTNLRSITDSAWKFTLRELSFHLPRLPEMLLVAIMKNIGSSCSESGTVCWTEEARPTLSQASVHSRSETAETVAMDDTGCNRLTSWCAWLLGKGSPQDPSCSSRKEPQKSKLLKISQSLSVSADINRDILHELLRLSLNTSNGRVPNVELVSMIAVRLQGNKFQHRAAALAQLGSSMQRTQWKNMDTFEHQETGVRIAVEQRVDESSLKGVSTSSPTGGDDRNLGSDLIDESALEIARSRQRAFLARLSLQRTNANASNSSLCCREPTSHSSSGSPQTATPMLAISQSKHHNSLLNFADVQSWTVVQNWRPCAIGMIPSLCHSIGIMSSLDMQRHAHGDELLVSKHPVAMRKEGPVKATLRPLMDENSLAAVAMDLVGGKKKNDEHLDSSVSGKRLKKTGCHVQFQDSIPLDVDKKDVANLCRSPSSRPLSLNQVGSPQKEEIHQRSAMQGCLLQHGTFMPVTPQQLECLQAAVHVL